MNIEKLKTEVKKGYPIFVVYTSDTKELVDWYPYGEKMARASAESRNNKVGPETYTYSSWQDYVISYNNYQRLLADLAEPWRHR